jgi:hypothetical protein
MTYRLMSATTYKMVGPLQLPLVLAITSDLPCGLCDFVSFLLLLASALISGAGLLFSLESTDEDDNDAFPYQEMVAKLY